MFRFSPLILLVAELVCGPLLQAQTAGDTAGLRIRVIPPAQDPLAGTSFDVDSRIVGSPMHLEVRASSEMTIQDQDLEAGAESTIRERAGFESLDFNEGNWSYQQIVCPTFPNHLLLRFSRTNGAGDVSMFSVSIPKSADGRVRIIPILRRGYSLFSPAPVNALTISAFNHIRAEEHADAPPDWVMTGLCYTALAGANSEAAFEPRDWADQAIPAYTGPVLEVLRNGGTIIRFVSLGARPTQWAMTLDRNGKLLKASHGAPNAISAKPVKPTVVAPNGKGVSPNVVETTRKPME